MTKQNSVRRSEKNIAGQVLTYNTKNFHRLNEKLHLEPTRGELGKLFLKKQIKQKKTKINVKIQLARTKALARNVNLIPTKN